MRGVSNIRRFRDLAARSAARIVRIDDWPERLNEYLREEHVFEWGQKDCVLFAMGAVEAMTLIDFGEDFRGQYDSARTAAIWMGQEFGVGSFVEAMEVFRQRWDGEELTSTLHAQRGDIVMAMLPMFEDGIVRPTLGVVCMDGQHAQFCVQAGSPTNKLLLVDCDKAWRVG